MMRWGRVRAGRRGRMGGLTIAALILAGCGGAGDGSTESRASELAPTTTVVDELTTTVADIADGAESRETEADRWRLLDQNLEGFNTVEIQLDAVRGVPCAELVPDDGAMTDMSEPEPDVARIDQAVRWAEVDALTLTSITDAGAASIEVDGVEMLAQGSVLLALHQLEGSGATFVAGIVPEPDRVRHLVVRTAEGELVYADTCESMTLSEQLLIDLGASLGPTATASQVLGSVTGAGPPVPGADLEALSALSRQDPFVPALEDSEGGQPGGLDEENFDDEQQAALTEAILEVGIPEQWRTSDATICTGSVWGSNECAVLDLEEEYRVFDGHLPLLVFVARDEPTDIRITIAGRFVGATVVDPANPVDPVGQPRAATARVRIDTDLTIEEFLGGGDGRIELIAS